MPIVPGPVSEARLARMVEAARRADFTYNMVGATGASTSPPGYQQQRASVDLGRGAGVFERAVDGLKRWEAHRGAGLTVVPEAPTVVGESVLVVLSLGVVTVVSPCRIVYVTEEVERFGFGYGTLAGHPERGEEAFHVVRTTTGVRFEIAAFSRPAHPLARLGSPVARGVQSFVTRRYLTGMKSFVERP